jgi:ubiquinone/menaquinone biosynthesis C-methylase UbiE
LPLELQHLKTFRDLLRCPRCLGRLSEDGSTALVCTACGLRPGVHGSILDFLVNGATGGVAPDVNTFYEGRPFPGYMPSDDAATLIDRARRSAFLRALDAGTPPDALVLDCGAGTGQLAMFLALAAPARQVIAADACRASLAEADSFRARASVSNLHLVRADLFALPVPEKAFDVVVSRGVVHHTPDVEGAIRSVASHVAPGGFLVLGFYETAARGLHCARRAVGRVAGKPIRFLDPILRRSDLDEEKKKTWIADQYHHPLERILPLPWVLKLLRGQGFQWVRTVPPAPDEASLFDPTDEPSSLGIAARRAGWFARGLGDEDAGLMCVVLRAPETR